MAEEDMADRKDATERRVYTLPASLLERLRAYQLSQGIASEAEAARRLLDAALQMRDTVTDILNTLESKFAEERDLRVLAADILAKHILVVSVKFSDDAVIFEVKNGTKGRIDADGKTQYSFDGDEENWEQNRKRPSSLRSRIVASTGSASWDQPRGGDLDDDIPF